MSSVYMVLMHLDVDGGLWVPAVFGRARDECDVLFNGGEVGTFFEARQTAKRAIRRTREWWRQRGVPESPMKIVRLKPEDQ